MKAVSPSTRTTAVDCKTRLHLGEEQMYTEFRQQLWTPLPLDQALEKAWTCAANVFHTCHQVVVEFFSSEDRIAAQVYDSVSIDDVKTKICVSTLIQLFKDIDRDVVVWRYVLTAVSGDYDQHQTTFSDATGWNVFEPVATGGTDSRVILRMTSCLKTKNVSLIASVKTLQLID